MHPHAGLHGFGVPEEDPKVKGELFHIFPLDVAERGLGEAKSTRSNLIPSGPRSTLALFPFPNSDGSRARF